MRVESRVEQRLKESGISLPSPPVPVASYTSAKKIGSIVYSSGQTATVDGVLLYSGKVGEDVSLEDAYQSARISALNCISALRMAVDLDRLTILKVTGFVNGAPGFQEQPIVINGASDLILEAFGEKGVHARCAIGAASLPNNASVEIEILAVEE